jgi:hypothetical protein
MWASGSPSGDQLRREHDLRLGPRLGPRGTPRFIEAARTLRSRVGRRWRVDATYIKVGKRWHYLFRAIDEAGQIVDVYLSERRDRTAAQPASREHVQPAP